MDASAADLGVGSARAYWPEIDGLRTIAVLSVFFFHLSHGLVPGGFVGVDVFFVISGYLITAILLSDIQAGTFSIAKFYQRRISRIFPALILVILCSLVAGLFLYSAQDFASLGANAAAAAASIINMKLISQGSYFVLSPDAQPLLHCWSLSVEDQYYVVFPLYLFAVVRLTRRPLAITLALAAVSFAACVWLTQGSPVQAFYLLPTRAWELLLGASLSLWSGRGGEPSARVASGSAWAGLALVAGSIALITEGDAFPGWIAAIPVIGTALLLLPVGHALPGPLKLLQVRPMVAVGKRSYSLYLWHWPVFSFVDYALFQSEMVVRTGLKIGLAFALAAATYAWVEVPLRRWLNVGVPRVALFVGTVAVIAAIAGGGLWLRSAYYFDVPPASIASGGVVVPGGDRATIVLAGDSQASMYGTTVAQIARDQRATLYAVGTAGFYQLPGDPDSHWAPVRQLIAAKKPDLVIFAQAWGQKLAENPRGLRRALAEIAGDAKHVLIVTQAPVAPLTLARAAIRDGARPPFLEPADQAERRRRSQALIYELGGGKVSIVDVAPLILEPGGALRVTGARGRLTYADDKHLSDEGTEIVRPALERAVAQALSDRR